MEDIISKLSSIFRNFPGIGSRQSTRFAYFLFNQSEAYRQNLAKQILDIKNKVKVCFQCFRYFPDKGDGKLCAICLSSDRHLTELMIVSTDTDLENLEKSGVYKGLYFVLGGLVPILEKNPEKKIRIKELTDRIQNSKKLKEIIIALNATPEGENTEVYLRNNLKDLLHGLKIKLSVLGRGISTGLELEYSDSETLESAFLNRHTIAK